MECRSKGYFQLRIAEPLTHMTLILVCAKHCVYFTKAITLRFIKYHTNQYLCTRIHTYI